jgi:hypothetical protein
MKWKVSLKAVSILVITVWLIHTLITHYLDSLDVFTSNIYLNIFLILVILSFCLSVRYIWLEKVSEP